MKIAIMGAGLSGLSCAIVLEKHGLHPTIFESRRKVGDRFINGELLFNFINKPINNCLDYLRQNYFIDLQEVNKIHKLILHSRNQVSSIDGNLGEISIRGRHKSSFENQLFQQINSEIIFNSTYTYEDLKKNFSHIVLATGDGEYSLRLNNYRQDLTVTLKGATVEGNFQPHTTSAWLNYEFVPKGYAYLIPYSNKEANIVIAFPDYPENLMKDIDTLWNRFFDQVCIDIDQNLKVTDKFHISRYIIGICKHPKISNTYFVGNCFGAILPVLGFGQFVSILTGIYAAYDILDLDTYESLAKPLFLNYENSLVLRRTLENLNEHQLDILIKSLDTKIIDTLVDSIFSTNSNFDVLKHASNLLKHIPPKKFT